MFACKSFLRMRVFVDLKYVVFYGSIWASLMKCQVHGNVHTGDSRNSFTIITLSCANAYQSTMSHKSAYTHVFFSECLLIVFFSHTYGDDAIVLDAHSLCCLNYKRNGRNSSKEIYDILEHLIELILFSWVQMVAR